MANSNPKPNLKPDCNPNTIPLPLTTKKDRDNSHWSKFQTILYAYSVTFDSSDAECGALLLSYRFIFSNESLEEVYLAMCERGLTPPNQARTSNVTCLRRLGGAAIGVT